MADIFEQGDEIIPEESAFSITKNIAAQMSSVIQSIFEPMKKLAEWFDEYHAQLWKALGVVVSMFTAITVTKTSF